MSKPVTVLWTETADELYARFSREQNVRRRQRLQALWLVRRGESVAEAARLAGVGQRSVERWLTWYREDGLRAVLNRVPGHGARGQPSRLTPDQQQALVAQTATGTLRTYQDARAWVAQTFGVAYSYNGMFTLLARLGVHPKVPRPQAAKTDPAQQEGWKRGAWPPPSTRRPSPRTTP